MQKDEAPTPDVPAPVGRRLSRPEAGLLVVLAIGAGLVGWKVFQQVRLGAPWDTYSYLANAARFAGKSIGYDEPNRPPVISLLTSIIFRFTPLDVWPIQAVDGLISFSALPALYLVLRRRVRQVPAAMCALGILSLQPVWYWLGMGYADFASVALTIWALFFAIKATEDDPRWYAAVLPTLVIASLTRVTALLGVFGILLWIALRGRPFSQARQLAYGAGAAAAVFAPAGFYYASRFGDIFFPYLVNLAMANEQFSRGLVGVSSEPGGWHPLPGLVVLIVGWLATWGVAASWWQHLKANRPRGRSILPVAAAAAVLAVTQVFGGLVARQIALPVGVYLVWRALAPREGDSEHDGRTTATAALDAVMLLLLLTYLDFHGHQPQKMWRYLITMAPPAMYFLALGWWRLARGAASIAGSRAAGGLTRPSRVGAKASWATLGVVLCGLLATNVIGTISAAPDPLAREAAATAKWIRAAEPDSDGLTVYSDMWPITSWYLGAEARAMPRFPDPRAFAHELSKRHADYYVTLGSERYGPAFAPAYASGGATVLARRIPDASDRPSVRYLGRAWENYVETLDDFRIDLFYDGGFEGWVGSVFMDAYPASELKRFNAVAIYRVRWYDRSRAERILGDYLAAGGTIMIDASGNIGGADYPMLDTILFDTVIRRREVPADAEITVSPGFAARHPDLPARVEGSWIDEGGDRWFGADYDPAPGTLPGETLLSLSGRPCVTLQRIGKGRVFWVGGNLMWHAFSRGDRREQALVQAVLDEAVDRQPVSDPGGTPSP